MKNVSIIICAYNEAGTIADVVRDCRRFNPDADVLVVDDGSTDHTESVLFELKDTCAFRYARLPVNRGKSWAMVHGVQQSDREIILFFDADVTNISREHFENILRPLTDNTADMVLGQPKETLINYRINPFKSLTGERALYKKDIQPVLEEIKEIRFGVETFINLYYQAEGKRIRHVLLDGLVHPTKYEKTSTLKATTEYFTEGHEITLTYLDNYELIIRRIENRINKASKQTRDKISKIHKGVNEKLMELKEKMNL